MTHIDLFNVGAGWMTRFSVPYNRFGAFMRGSREYSMEHPLLSTYKRSHPLLTIHHSAYTTQENTMWQEEKSFTPILALAI
jgi:hypothetical protein